MINSLEFLRLVDLNRDKNFAECEVYGEQLLYAAIDESIKMGRPWVTFHAPLWCLDMLQRKASAVGFTFKVNYGDFTTDIKEVTLHANPNIIEQHQKERLARVEKWEVTV